MKKSSNVFRTVLLLISTMTMVGCRGNTSSSTAATSSTTTSSTATSSAATSSAAETVTPFTGTANFTGLSFEDKTDLLGQMESYAMKNHLVGIPLYGSGGYTLLSTRFNLPVDKYITNYGFGLLREGSVKTAMTDDQEPTKAYQNYYHTETTSVAGNLNAGDASDTLQSTMTGYITSSFWNTRLIKNNDAGKTYKAEYEYYPSYAQELPQAVDMDDTGSAHTWRFKVKTGKNSGLQYRTLSTKSIDGVSLSSFDKTDVTVNDYIFAMKTLMTYSYNNYYYFQYASDTAEIDGAWDYVCSTVEGGMTTDDAKAAWDNVGFKAVDDETIEVKFVYPTNQFGVMYRLGDSLIAPINEEFYRLVTTQSKTAAIDSEDFDPTRYGKYSSDTTYTPADTTLSCGPYTVEKYETGTGTDNIVTFVKNDEWIETVNEKADTGYDIYQIPGIKISINTAAKTDSEAVYKDFKAGKTDAASIPSADAAAEAGDAPYKYWVEGDSVWKMQCNTLTQTEWNEIFGDNGYVYEEYKSGDNAYTCKPIMSNDNFINGVYCAINRKELAEKMNSDVASSFYSNAYEIDPINHVIYNESEAHKNAMKDYFPDTYGYNLEAAKTLFGTAIDELLADKSYTAGTKDNPTEIHVSFMYMEESQIESEGKTTAKYITDAFNAVGLDKGVKLVLDLTAPADWSDIYYEYTLKGKFDFAYASISGGTLDPINFMQILRSDSASTFTLSWGAHTYKDDGDIVYDGHSYSFDAVYDALNYGETEVVNGEEPRE